MHSLFIYRYPTVCSCVCVVGAVGGWVADPDLHRRRIGKLELELEVDDVESERRSDEREERGERSARSGQ